jgi:hypothetical protein
MTTNIELSTWLYVLVQDPGESEHIVGQEDAQSKLAFIPAFADKGSATQGVMYMTKEKGHKYEVQAIIFEDLIDHAAKGPFLIFVLDETGAILQKFSPDGQPL